MKRRQRFTVLVLMISVYLLMIVWLSIHITDETRDQLYDSIVTAHSLLAGQHRHLKDISRQQSFPPDVKCTESLKSSNYIMLDFKPGRTGNALNQLFCLLALSSKFCYTPLIGPLNMRPFDWYVEPFFKVRNIKRMESIDNRTFHLLSSEQFNVTLDQISHHRYNRTLTEGSLGFDVVMDKEQFVRSSIQPKPSYLNRIKTYLHMHFLHRSTVAIHVRRTDKLNVKLFHSKYGDLEWYKPHIGNAMELLKQRYTNLSFIFVTDDKAWCKEQFHGDNIDYSPCKTVGCDFALIGQCDHVILTLGTFGITAAWLGGVKSVIYSRKHVYGYHVRHNAYLPSWTNIDEYTG